MRQALTLLTPIIPQKQKCDGNDVLKLARAEATDRGYNTVEEDVNKRNEGDLS